MERECVLIEPNSDDEHHLGNRLYDEHDPVCKDCGQRGHAECIQPEEIEKCTLCEFEGEEPMETELQGKEIVTIASRWPEQEQHLVSCFAKHLDDKITKLIKKNWYGCQNDRPSQI